MVNLHSILREPLPEYVLKAILFIKQGQGYKSVEKFDVAFNDDHPEHGFSYVRLYGVDGTYPHSKPTWNYIENLAHSYDDSKKRGGQLPPLNEAYKYIRKVIRK